ncbi:SEP-domain-containing protein [Sporormia fimetaria CBS 119925]|uniref:SEP-domain-containing protein n=1 Tax=Sporormia fimetaria CBS 119925 TaxID=1340428 RepID=A0A6A6V0K8_9PLEO|nr:SEP-domain-containing protein [Sporormia fimetaria CBS 119925]
MSSSAPEDRDSLVAQLSSLTGLSASEAEQYLTAANGDLPTAASLFFDGSGPGGPDAGPMADDDEQQNSPPSPPPAVPQQGGGRTLGGAYVPPEASSSSSSSSQPGAASRQQQRQGGLRTLKELQSAGAGQDDDDDKDKNHDFFTGGEKSGLAVQNPNAGPRSAQEHIRNMIEQARRNTPRDGDDEDGEPPARSHFRGAGVTLGGDDAPSRMIPDPEADVPQRMAPVRRALHLWRNGFSVDDGPLHRFDDPANAEALAMMNAGRAPYHVLNVAMGQPVDVELHRHEDEDYKAPKKKYVPFAGSGQRLGSPTPGVTSTPPPAPAATQHTAAASTSAPAQPSVDIDSSVPVVTLQIRLGDGTRLQSRFNTTHTVGDVYKFVDAARPDSQQRAYALMTTFPSKELSDKAQVLGDMAEFKRGGVVVQKWL